jgi:hypothetical protein
MNKDNNNGLLYTLSELILNNPYAIEEEDVPLTQHEVVVLLNKKNNQIKYLEEKLEDERIAIIKKDDEINELIKENNMLKIAIGRNESYINRLKSNGKWTK